MEWRQACNYRCTWRVLNGESSERTLVAPTTFYKAHFKRSRIRDEIKKLVIPKLSKFLNSSFIKRLKLQVIKPREIFSEPPVIFIFKIRALKTIWWEVFQSDNQNSGEDISEGGISARGLLSASCSYNSLTPRIEFCSEFCLRIIDRPDGA